MKHLLIISMCFIYLLPGFIVLGQDDETEEVPGRVTLECDDDIVIQDGVSIVIGGMVSNLDYTVTVLGVGSFDPTLAVIQEDGLVDCVDDSRQASKYVADLPTTGFVDAQNRNAQIKFKNDIRRGQGDVQIIIGEARQKYGEFLLIVEGMAVHQFSDAGDIFSITLTDSLLASRVPPTAYALSVISGEEGLDPVIELVDSDGIVMTDSNEEPIDCDDAGFDDFCWGNSVVLDGYYVSRTFNRTLDTTQWDAMLTYVPTDADVENGMINFQLGSYQGGGFGDYIAVFHVGIMDPNAVPESTPETEATEEAETNN